MGSVAAKILFILSILIQYSTVLTQEGVAIAFSDSLSGLPQLGNIEVVEEQEDDAVVIEGESPAKVVVERVVSYPETGLTDVIILRNEGGKVANLTGWTLTDDKLTPELMLGLPGCEGNVTIEPQQKLILQPLDENNPCGFPFGISFKDQILLRDENGELVSNVTWDVSEKGAGIHKVGDDYMLLSLSNTVMDVLESIDQFSKFVFLLKETGLDTFLTNDADPDYTHPKLSPSPSPDYLVEFPWWFGWQVDRTTIPSPPPPPPPPPSPPMGEIPKQGPYTILAPTNDAIDELLLVLTGGRVRLPIEMLVKQPELKSILQYHIVYGMYTSDYMFNNTGIQSTLGPEVVVMREPRWTDGYIAINDACVDKPTSGYPCAQQLEFDKCWEPFMISPLAAGWQGGFCQKTCQRCSCDPEIHSCALIQDLDLQAGNGIVQGISRVLFPPQLFDEDDVDGPIPEGEYDGDIVVQNGDLPTLPTLPSLPSLTPVQPRS